MTLVANHVLLPHPPDWINRPRGGRRWQTSTGSGITGAEDRQANARRAFRSLEYQLTFFSVVEREDFLPRLQAGLKSGRTAVPFWSRGQLLSANCSTTTLLFTGAFRFAIGDYVFFRDPDTGFSESILVDGVSGNTLTLHAAPSRTWAAGEMFWPLLFGRIVADNGRAMDPERLSLAIKFTEPSAAADAVISSSASCPVPSGAASPGSLNVCPTDEPPAGMMAWYRASSANLINGEIAVPCPDLGPNGYDLTDQVGGSGADPIYATNVLNGLPVMSWDAQDGMEHDIPDEGDFTSGTTGDPAGFTIAIVMRKILNNTSSVFRLVTSFQDATNTSIRLKTTATDVIIRGVGIASSNNAADLTVPLNTWQVVTSTFDNVESIVRLRTNDLTGQSAFAGASGFLVFEKIVMQMPDGKGEIAEVLFYPSKLSDGNLARLRNYLSTRYGIAITV